MAQLFPIVVDYETFWTPTHSLSKMSPMAYVMHPDTEVISCAIKEGDKPTYCVFGETNVRYALQQIDWSNKILVAHNNEGFDAMISAWRFGIKPAMWACTLAMARPYHAKTCGLSLAKLVEHYQLGVKDNTALVKTQGKRLKDFTPDEIRAMSAYNTADTDQCFQLFKILLTKTPRDELRIIDSCIRMLVEPAFELDVDLLTDTLAKEKQRKRDTVLKLASFLGVDGIDAQEEVTNTLASAPKFSALLGQLGAEVPMKPSPTDPDKLIPALAKTDQGMLDLLESDNEIVAAAAEARLGVKSTLLETRIQKFLESAAACGGRLPIPVKYYGADTTGRLSGWSYNPLNLPRINPYEPKLSDALRKSMRAPKGFKVVVADLSGIELRVNHFLWKEPESMALFRADPEKADLYKSFASALYGVEVAEVSKTQRQLGKIAQLGLGFGAGAATFRKVAKTMGGVDIPLEAAPVPLEFLDADGYLTPEGQAWEQSQPTAAKDVVSKWRDKYGEIVRGWRVCHQALSSIYAGSDDTVDPWHMISTTPEGFKTPRGFILYPELRQEVDEKSGKVEWKYGAGRHTARIYAGKVTENIVQHLARSIINDHKLAVRKATGRLPAMEVYDELVYVVPEAEAESHLATLLSVMRTSPTWWPELVLWAEGDIADTYGDAK